MENGVLDSSVVIYVLNVFVGEAIDYFYNVRPLRKLNSKSYPTSFWLISFKKPNPKIWLLLQYWETYLSKKFLKNVRVQYKYDLLSPHH